MALEIHVDRNLCIGSGQCTIAAARTFDLDNMSIAIVINPEGDPPAAIFEAEDICPSRAIQVFDPVTRSRAR